MAAPDPAPQQPRSSTFRRRRDKLVVLVAGALDCGSGNAPLARAPLVCDVSRIDRADLETVDALARIALAARRAGRRVLLRGASPELRSMLAFAGLADVLTAAGGSGVEARGEAEQREELPGVEEEGDPADPIT